MTLYINSRRIILLSLKPLKNKRYLQSTVGGIHGKAGSRRQRNPGTSGRPSSSSLRIAALSGLLDENSSPTILCATTSAFLLRDLIILATMHLDLGTPCAGSSRAALVPCREEACNLPDPTGRRPFASTLPRLAVA
eukprot:CAMPEP_0198246454 /NCGR_PEP_ID=MMETSP1446-20131203/45984_1 /TAXON_ID=1461542 ORGANISM="Unidentified sp, Strain CCMP2111" /NCGR_SAMPLE_ID=MMETSP1446 /ASSEMBLY_ACC=CAM_ASM_001112 /LENGTH=135 /DNA_ID=CAMNT_0043930775 /DNA_START=729 /DNA_END=1132 /DNA_ORIENTATION=-